MVTWFGFGIEKLLLIVVSVRVTMMVMKVIMMMMVTKVIMSTWLNIGLEKLVAWDFSAASSLAASTAFCRY